MEWLGIIVSKVVNMGGLHREGEVIIKILNNSGPRNEPCGTFSCHSLNLEPSLMVSYA